jgi:hypothetical protein
VNVREPAMMRRMGASLLQRAERAYGVSKKTGFFPGIFLRLCAAAGHLRVLASSPAPGFLPLAGVYVMLCEPWPRSGRLLRHFLFFPPDAAQPNQRERVSRRGPIAWQWGGRGRPGLDAGANGDYLASPSRRKKRRSTLAAAWRLPGCAPRRTPARIRQASWCLRGSTGPEGPGSTQPGSKRPIELQPAAVWLGSGGAEPPDGAHDTARCIRRERACPARAGPATDV